MDKKIKCIYCNAVQNITDSDVIPYALTGAKLHKKFVCEQHNKFTNDQYESMWIKSLAVFRNLLGFTTREGKSVSYNAMVTIGDKELENVKFTNVATLLENPKSIHRIKGSKNILFGNIDSISKIAEARGGEILDVDLSSFTISTTLSSTSFTSSSVLHAIAKIAYESHCYFNDIKEYCGELYGEIVNYILDPTNDNLIVEMVTDKRVYDLFDKCFIYGTNTIFEYDDSDGYRYVIFGLWNVVFYKIKVCQSNLLKTSNKPCAVHAFYPDGEVATVVGVVGKHITAKKAVDALSQIYNEIAKRLECLYQPYFSYKSLLRQKKRFEEKLLKLKNGKIFINEFLEIGNIATICGIYIFELLLQNRERYQREISFLNNLRLFVGSDKVALSDDLLNNLVKRYFELYETGEFIDMLEQAFKFFDTLTE